MGADIQLQPIDLTNWRFLRRHDGASDHAMGTVREPDVFKFADGRELVRFLSEQEEYRVQFHQEIERRLENDPVTRSWKQSRTLLRHMPHFRRYRKNCYRSYQSASSAVSRGQPSEQQSELYHGLLGEISTSKTVLPIGQTLFHAAEDGFVGKCNPYPRFVSTTLNPIVAMNHARPRTRQGRGEVFCFHVKARVPAIWGQAGNTHEWELLLPPHLTIIETMRERMAVFDFVTAEVTRCADGP